MITAPTQFSGLQVWLDASDTTKLFQLSGGTTAVAANLDPVGYWGDKSGNNRHFTNIGGSATTRPTWVSSLSTVRFDGSNDYLSSFFNITYTAQTVFVVVSQRVFVSNARIYTQVSSGGADQSATGFYIPGICGSPAGNDFFSSYVTPQATRQCSVANRGLSAYDILTSRFSSISATNFVNGVAGASFGSTLNYAVALSRLGAAATTANNYFNGDISEVIVYNRALTNNERADVEYYLTRKWNFLNSIPRQVYGIKNGLWSLTDTWSVSAEPSPWNFPLSADNAYTNTFTITADSSTKVDTIRNSTLAPNILSGGSFVLANGVSLSANVLGGAAPYTLTLNPAATATLVGNFTNSTVTSVPTFSATSGKANLYGNITGGTVGGVIVNANSASLDIVGNIVSSNSVTNTFTNSSTGVVNISGNITGPGNTAHTLENASSGTININGRITAGGSTGFTIRNSSTGTINITGNLIGGTATVAAVNNNSTGNINVLGNVLGGTGSTNSTLTNSGAGFVSLTGDIISGGASGSTATGNTIVVGNIYSSNAANALASSSTTVPLSVYGNIINAPNGRQAIYAPRYQVFPTGSAQYTRQASNGYDSYVDYWTSNSTFSYPASSDVALGTTYSNSTLSGSMAVPSPSSVALGALVGTTTGTASITLDNVLSQPIANLTTPNSIGARLKNITTSQALSAIVDSLEF